MILCRKTKSDIFYNFFKNVNLKHKLLTLVPYKVMVIHSWNVTIWKPVWLANSIFLTVWFNVILGRSEDRTCGTPIWHLLPNISFVLKSFSLKIFSYSNSKLFCNFFFALIILDQKWLFYYLGLVNLNILVNGSFQRNSLNLYFRGRVKNWWNFNGKGKYLSRKSLFFVFKTYFRFLINYIII